MLRIVSVVALLLFLFLHNVPYLVRDQAVLWLLNHGAEHASLKSIQVDWFAARVTVKKLTAEAENRPALSLDRFTVDVAAKDLFQKRLRIEEIIISGVQGAVEQKKSALWLGPVDLNSFKREPSEVTETDTGSDWQFGVVSLQLQDIDWRSNLKGQKHHLVVDQGTMSDLYLWDHQQPVTLNLQGQINGADLSVQSLSKPLPETKHSEIVLKLNQFPLHSVTALWYPDLRADVDLDLTLELQTNLTTGITSLSQQGQITLGKLKLKQGDISLQQNKLHWQGDVDLELEKEQVSRLAGKHKLNLYALNLQQKETLLELDKLALSTKVTSSGIPQLTLSDLSLQLDDLQLQQQNKRVKLAQLMTQGDLQSDDLKIWHGGVNQLMLNNVGLAAGSADLLQLQQMVLEQVKLQHSDKIEVNKMTLERLRVQGESQQVAQWQQLNFDQLVLLNLDTLSIDQVSLQGSEHHLRLGKERQLQDMEWILAQLQNPVAETVEIDGVADGEDKSEPGEAPFNFSIGQILVQGDNKIKLEDGGVDPSFSTELALDELQLGPIDNRSDQATQFELKGKNGFSVINLSGAIKLFDPSHDGRWQLDLKGLELPQLSPYAMQYSGYYLHSGQLNLKSDGEIKERALKGDVDILLNRLEVEARNDEKSGEFNQKVSMPLETALMILQDNDDNIDLKIPIEGSLDDPQFGYQSVINKLAGKGLKSAAMGYLSKALQPFGTLITLTQMAMDAQQKGSFITLQPIIFSAASGQLSTEATEYLAKLGGMLNDRKAMRLNICGSAVISDWLQIELQRVEANKKLEKPLPAEQLQQRLEQEKNQLLQKLAEKRSEQVKAVLHKQHGISIERLFLCYPQIDLNKEQQPSVTLGL